MIATANDTVFSAGFFMKLNAKEPAATKIIGSAYALIFWIQNIGLWLFPMLIGKVLDATNPELVEQVSNGVISR